MIPSVAAVAFRVCFVVLQVIINFVIINFVINRPSSATDKRGGFSFACFGGSQSLSIFAGENLSGARSLNRFNAFATPRHQRRSIILTVHLPTLNAISIRIIWKGSAAISIAKIGGSLHHLSTFETPTAATVWGFLFNVLS